MWKQRLRVYLVNLAGKELPSQIKCRIRGMASNSVAVSPSGTMLNLADCCSIFI
jgi:hypothetical protein